MAELKTKLFFEMIQNIFAMISKPIIVVVVLKLLILRGDPFNL